MSELEQQVRWRSIGQPSDDALRYFYEQRPKMTIELPPHIESLPDHTRLTVMAADHGSWVLHLFLGDLRRLLALQSTETR